MSARRVVRSARGGSPATTRGAASSASEDARARVVAPPPRNERGDRRRVSALGREASHERVPPVQAIRDIVPSSWAASDRTRGRECQCVMSRHGTMSRVLTRRPGDILGGLVRNSCTTPGSRLCTSLRSLCYHTPERELALARPSPRPRTRSSVASSSHSLVRRLVLTDTPRGAPGVSRAPPLRRL